MLVFSLLSPRLQSLTNRISQIHCQLILAKAAASKTESPDILDPLQVDRMCALLTNGEQWLVYSEQDGAGCVAPYVLDGAKHAIAALLTALFLGVMTAPSANMTLPKSAGRDATSTSPTSSEREPKRLKMEQVVRFLEDAVPRCVNPQSKKMAALHVCVMIGYAGNESDGLCCISPAAACAKEPPRSARTLTCSKPFTGACAACCASPLRCTDYPLRCVAASRAATRPGVRLCITVRSSHLRSMRRTRLLITHCVCTRSEWPSLRPIA